MPVVVKIRCECGSADGYRIDADTGECWDCGHICARITTVPNVGGRMWNKGDGDSGGIFIKQAGRSFHSESEMMTWADDHGLEAVAPDSDRWKNIKYHNRNEADKDAKRDGFSSAKERSDLIKYNKRDMLARSRQKKIDAYHDEHGSDGKQTVEQAFGDLD